MQRIVYDGQQSEWAGQWTAGIRLFGQMNARWHEARLDVKNGCFVHKVISGSHTRFKSVGMVERRCLRCFGHHSIKNMGGVTLWS